MTTDRKLARDVAKQLDRRRMRRKLFVYAAIATAIALAIMFVTCGRGWGLGGKGKGDGTGPGTGAALIAPVDAGPRRCVVKLSPEGITVDGQPTTRDEAIAICKATLGADVIVTGDTREGDWEALRTALDAAGVTIFKREPKTN